MTDYEARIAKVEDRIRAERERLRDLQAIRRKEDQRRDSRRKILYGAALLAAVAEISPDRRRLSLGWVERKITRPKDRAFLGLPPLGEPDVEEPSSS